MSWTTVRIASTECDDPEIICEQVSIESLDLLKLNFWNGIKEIEGIFDEANFV